MTSLDNDNGPFWILLPLEKFDQSDHDLTDKKIKTKTKTIMISRIFIAFYDLILLFHFKALPGRRSVRI